MNDHVERLIFHMKPIAGQTGNEWASSFAKSILKQSKRRGWVPSDKQKRLMEKLVSELFEQELILIEEF